MTLIEATNLTYGIQPGRPLASGLNFSLQPGQTLFVTGPNGSGKSTLLRVLLGQLAPFEGTITRKIAMPQVAILPQLQNPGFHLPITLKDVLTMSSRGPVHWDEVHRLGLLSPEHLSLAWNTASGGERKRTLLTRILLQKPSLLILDEPMNHLDQKSRAQIRGVIARYLSESTEAHRAVVLVSHERMNAVEMEALRPVHLPLGSADHTGAPCEEDDCQ